MFPIDNLKKQLSFIKHGEDADENIFSKRCIF